MNCQFHILWFEDEGSFFRSNKIVLEGILQEHQLSACFTKKTGSDLSDGELTGNEYDLILMDYMLDDNVTGDKVIETIRYGQVLTDIMFYSADYDRMTNSIKESSPPIDGGYYAQRKSPDFEDKARKLIEKIIHRSEDLINLRGFVLDNACDFEVRIQTLLDLVWQRFSPAERNELNVKAQERIASNVSREKASVEKVTSAENIFFAALTEEYFFSIADYLVVLNSAIELLKKNHGFASDDFSRDFNKEYTNKITVYRNALGHRTATDKSLEIRRQAVCIDAELHKMMRRNIHCIEARIQLLEAFVEESLTIQDE